MDEAIRRLIQSRAVASEIKTAAIRAGTRSLRDDGIAKILEGITTSGEVERVTAQPEEDAIGDASTPVAARPDLNQT